MTGERRPSGVIPVRAIVGNAEVRKICGGVTRHTLLNWRRKLEFPEPIRRLQCGELWDSRAVRAWLRARTHTGE